MSDQKPKLIRLCEGDPGLVDGILVKRLLVYAQKCMRKHEFSNDKLLSFADPADYVQIAIVKALSGQRKRKAGVTLEALLFGSVKSEMSNAYNKMENKVTTSYDRSGLGIVSIKDARSSQEDQLSTEQEKTRLINMFQFDPFLCKVADAYVQHDCAGPQDVALHLSVPVSQIYKAHKKMKKTIEGSPLRTMKKEIVQSKKKEGKDV